MQIVSADRLIDVVWGDKAPATASNTLQRHMSYLRGVLDDRTAIVARAPGYALELPGDATDVEVAERYSLDGARTRGVLHAALHHSRRRPTRSHP